jgi:hypothetical protein
MAINRRADRLIACSTMTCLRMGTSTPAGLISLKNYSMQYELTPGDLFMLLSWSPHVFCVSLLRFVSYSD